MRHSLSQAQRREKLNVELSSLATEQGARKRINDTRFVASVTKREIEMAALSSKRTSKLI